MTPTEKRAARWLDLMAPLLDANDAPERTDNSFENASESR